MTPGIEFPRKPFLTTQASQSNMKLTSKVTLLLVGVIATTFVINFFVLNTTVMSQFVQYEREAAVQNANRVMQAIEREASFLQTTATDWAYWTDTYDFVSGKPSDYADQNLMDATLVSLNVNTLFFVNRNGNVHWGKVLDLESEDEISLSELPTDKSWTSHSLVHSPDAHAESVFTGALPTEQGILVFASAPILNSEQEGPSAGTLVFGKLLTESVVAQLAQQTGVDFQLIEPDTSGLPEIGNDHAQPIVLERSEMVLNTFLALRDTAGKIVSVIKTESPRDITLSGSQTLMTALALLVLAGVAMLSAVALGLRVIALNPLSHLTKTVVNIAQTGNLKNRSNMKRGDEIGVLSTQFDAMLDKLEDVNGELGDRLADLNRINAELAFSEARANELAHHDSITGLPNRLAMLEHLDRMIELGRNNKSRCAIIFADLDRFKQVNDSLGHSAGDELIRQTANRIRQVAGPSAHVSRLGGDEFALICENADEAEAICQRIIDCFDEPFSIVGNVIKASMSLGLAAFDSDSLDTADLMRRADIALYSSKDEGRDQYQVFHEGLDKDAVLKHDLMRDLVAALDNDDLYVNYQPLVSPDGRTITGLEALSRWSHPERGDIATEIFVSMAEDTGLIHTLGAWVIRTAMRDAGRWPGMTVAINLSPIQFYHHGFVDQVLAIAAETKTDTSRIELEITENVLMGDIAQAISKLKRLKEAGFRLVLDDFGAGHASLNYLRRIPFDKLKIDRSFTMGIGTTVEDMQIIHAIVNLARALNLAVTAEGVETADQYEFLQTTGCSQLQGFWFHRPMHPNDIDRVISEQQTLIRSA